MNQNLQVKSGKKSKGVRFQTDEGDIFVPERKEVPSGIRRLERQSSRPRATEALDYLLAGNRRFREVPKISAHERHVLIASLDFHVLFRSCKS